MAIIQEYKEHKTYIVTSLKRKDYQLKLMFNGLTLYKIQFISPNVNRGFVIESYDNSDIEVFLELMTEFINNE